MIAYLPKNLQVPTIPSHTTVTGTRRVGHPPPAGVLAFGNYKYRRASRKVATFKSCVYSWIPKTCLNVYTLLKHPKSVPAEFQNFRTYQSRRASGTRWWFLWSAEGLLCLVNRSTPGSLKPSILQIYRRSTIAHRKGFLKSNTMLPICKHQLG